MTSGHVILVYLYIRKMSEYAAINDVYKTVFDVNPPIRLPRAEGSSVFLIIIFS